MPTLTTATRIVVVCLPAGALVDWYTVCEAVDHHLATTGVAVHRFPVRHRRLTGLVTRWSSRHLLHPWRRFGAVAYAAGGPVGRLDLTRVVAQTSAAASARWRAWQHQVARTTPSARPWEDFLAQHHANPDKVSLAEATRRFEAQPRVLTMLSLLAHPNAPYLFDPAELAAYQAGQAAYVCLHWRTAIAGDALITAEGQLLRPQGPTLADRLRYLQQAATYIHRLRRRQRMCALAVD
jgi:hypothetical protein